MSITVENGKSWGVRYRLWYYYLEKFADEVERARGNPILALWLRDLADRNWGMIDVMELEEDIRREFWQAVYQTRNKMIDVGPEGKQTKEGHINCLTYLNELIDLHEEAINDDNLNINKKTGTLVDIVDDIYMSSLRVIKANKFLGRDTHENDEFTQPMETILYSVSDVMTSMIFDVYDRKPPDPKPINKFRSIAGRIIGLPSDYQPMKQWEKEMNDCYQKVKSTFDSQQSLNIGRKFHNVIELFYGAIPTNTPEINYLFGFIYISENITSDNININPPSWAEMSHSYFSTYSINELEEQYLENQRIKGDVICSITNKDELKETLQLVEKIKEFLFQCKKNNMGYIALFK